MRSLLSAVLAVAAFAAAAELKNLPLTAEGWEQENPIGDLPTNGVYDTAGGGGNGFLLAKDVPVSNRLRVSADSIPGESTGPKTDWKLAGLALYESRRWFWHLMLAENPQGGIYCEINEMRDGVWCSNNDLKATGRRGNGSWKRGVKYTIDFAVGDGKVVGSIRETATGNLIYAIQYELKPASAHRGRPALKAYGLEAKYVRVAADWSDPVPQDEVNRNAKKAIPPYVSPETLVQDGPLQKGTGFFRVAKDGDGRWSFVDPTGKPFFMAACSSISYEGDRNFKLGYAPYGKSVRKKFNNDEDAWARSVSERLRRWGFSSYAGGSESMKYKGLAHSFILAIGQTFATCGDEFDILPCDGGPCTAFPNVFHPKFPAYCRWVASRRCAPNKDDPWLIGYYIDNELSWWGDARKWKTKPCRGLFDAAAKKGATHTAHKAVLDFLKARGVGSIEAASDQDRLDFVRLCAHKYWEETTKAIRWADPNHLVLGCRTAGISSTHAVCWEEAGKYTDVYSVNVYPVADLDRKAVFYGGGRRAPKLVDMFDEYAKNLDRPIIITEWSFTALDSGLTCMHGAGQRFFTQKERAEAASLFARTIFGMPKMAGYVFFKWSDQPYYGRVSEESENSNYGLVNANDDYYPEITAALAEIQLNPKKYRRLPPPEPIVPASAAPAVEKARKTAVADAAPVTFDQAADGSFRMANGKVAMEGKVGQDCIRVNGKAVLGTMIREYRGGKSMWWSSAARVESARGGVRDGVGSLEFVLGGKSSDGIAFRTVCRLYLPAGRDFFYYELRSIENAGSRPLDLDTAYLKVLPEPSIRAEARPLPDARLAPPKEGEPTHVPPSLWMPWTSGAWLCEGSNTVIAAVAPRASDVIVGFSYHEGRKSHHADASASLGRRTLAPGEAYAPDSKPAIACGVTTGGVTGWANIFTEIRAAE